MIAEWPAEQIHTLPAQERERLRHMIAEASEPIAQFWPMKNFVHHNPIHGLEHLPFDKAVREAQQLLGGAGYLANEEYRELYKTGRITPDGVTRALQRVGPRGSRRSFSPFGIHSTNGFLGRTSRAQSLTRFTRSDHRGRRSRSSRNLSGTAPGTSLDLIPTCTQRSSCS